MCECMNGGIPYLFFRRRHTHSACFFWLFLPVPSVGWLAHDIGEMSHALVILIFVFLFFGGKGKRGRKVMGMGGY